MKPLSVKISGQLVTSLALFIMASSTPSALSLESLPTGEYYYQLSDPVADQVSSQSAGQATRDFAEQSTGKSPLTSSMSGQSVLLRKAGRTVIGVQLGSGSGNPCFRGFVQGNRIVNATRVFPPYNPAARSDFQPEMFDLSEYSQVEAAVSEADRATLQTCMQFFWR
jgi:hypothetical protein